MEGVLGAGAPLASFFWFLEMPAGMAFGVGFGIVLLLDVVRALTFGYAPSDRSRLDAPEVARR